MIQLRFLDQIDGRPFVISDPHRSVLIVGPYGESCPSGKYREGYITDIDSATELVYLRLGWQRGISHPAVAVEPDSEGLFKETLTFLKRHSTPVLMPIRNAMTFRYAPWTVDEANFIRMLRDEVSNSIPTATMKTFLMMYIGRRFPDKISYVSELVDALIGFVGTIVIWTPKSQQGIPVHQTAQVQKLNIDELLSNDPTLSEINVPLVDSDNLLEIITRYIAGAGNIVTTKTMIRINSLNNDFLNESGSIILDLIENKKSFEAARILTLKHGVKLEEPLIKLLESGDHISIKTIAILGLGYMSRFFVRDRIRQYVEYNSSEYINNGFGYLVVEALCMSLYAEGERHQDRDEMRSLSDCLLRWYEELSPIDFNRSQYRDILCRASPVIIEELLTRWIENGSLRIKKLVCEVAGLSGIITAVPHLTRLLKSDPEIKEAVANALAHICQREAAESLLQDYTDVSLKYLNFCVHTLSDYVSNKEDNRVPAKKLFARTITRFQSFLGVKGGDKKNTNGDFRSVHSGLGDLSSSLDLLIEKFEHQPTHVKYMLIRSIGLNKKIEHVGLITESTQSSDPILRGVALLAASRFNMRYTFEIEKYIINSLDKTEKILDYLALISLNPEVFDDVSSDFKKLLETSYSLRPEFQADILYTLASTNHQPCMHLAEALAPLYFPAAIEQMKRIKIPVREIWY